MTWTRCAAALLAATAVVSSAGLSAHEKFKIVGTVMKVHTDQLDVKALDGQIYEIDFTRRTVVTEATRKVDRSQLRAGRSVVVHALGHDMFDLEAVEVQLVRAPGRQQVVDAVGR